MHTFSQSLIFTAVLQYPSNAWKPGQSSVPLAPHLQMRFAARLLRPLHRVTSVEQLELDLETNEVSCGVSVGLTAVQCS